MGEARDEEMERAIALSQKTYAEEQERRLAADTDLINLNAAPLQDQERKKTIDSITRLYSQPHSLNTLTNSSMAVAPVGASFPTLIPTQSTVGWSPHVAAGQTPPPFPPHPQFHYPHPMGSISCPVPAPIGFGASFGAPMPGQMPPPPLFPRQKRASESSVPSTAPVLPPYDPFSPKQLAAATARLSTSSSMSTLPSVAAPPPLHPRRSAAKPPLPVVARSQPQSPVSQPPDDPLRSSTVPPSSHYEEPPYANELVLPYSQRSVRYPAIANGDLIDFDDNTDSLDEQIRREFDPLYRDVVPAALYPSLSSSASTSAISAAAPVVRVKSVAEGHEPRRDGANRKSLPARPASTTGVAVQKEEPLVLEVICAFTPRSPALLQQFDLLHSEVHPPKNAIRFYSSVSEHMQTTVDAVQIIVSKDHLWPRSDQPSTLTLTCDTSLRVEVVLIDILASFLPDDGGDLPIHEYALKVFGLDEILPNSSIFGKNIYVGTCLLHGKDIKLEVGKLDVKSMLGPRVSYGRLTDQIIATSVIDPQDIHNVAVTLKLEMEGYEESATKGDTIKVAHFVNKVKQIVKLLCTLCGNIQPVELHKRLQNYVTSSVERLSPTRNDLIAALHGLVYVFCNSSMSMHCIAPIRKIPSRKLAVNETREKLKVVVNSLHNLRESWMQEVREYFVEVRLLHGTILLENFQSSNGKNVHSDALFPYVPLQLFASFDKELCTLPRESKFVIVLSGIYLESKDGQESLVKKHLASTALSLFDHEGILRHGQVFLPLRNINEDRLEPWGGTPIIGNGKDPVVVVTLPFHDDYQIVFPEVEDVARTRSERLANASNYDISSLAPSDQEMIFDIIEFGSMIKLDPEMAELLWQKRHHLCNIPEALPFVLISVSDWAIPFLPSVYEILNLWSPLPPILALQLLLPQFPDKIVRKKAVEWIESASERSSEFVFSFLPVLVEALRFEVDDHSPLARFLLNLTNRDAKFAFEIYWQLQQRIDHSYSNDFNFSFRCNMLAKELLTQHGTSILGAQIVKQRQLLDELDRIQNDLKNIEGERSGILRTRLGIVDSTLLSEPIALPILPAFKCSGICVSECSVFNSAAKPLRIVFKGITEKYPVIHKSGDDMRQDALVLHLVSVMNDIWIERGLDLKMIVFRCMVVGYRKGMAQLVPDCATLCDIQSSMGGLKGVFKDDVLQKYLVKHNSSDFFFKQAHDNFTRSCAGWCVATYLLGIGDRHNDNILVTTRGHVFHIDFGKYMGDWQMAGSFKRDRVPFVFTPEMAFVVNGGSRQTANYQTFVDYCTKAFQYLRGKSNTILNLLRLMACSGIPGINPDSIMFVEENLMLSLSENEATVQFTQMLQSSLQSAFPRLNFAIHSMAQMLSGGGSSADDNHKLSFVPQLYNEITDGRITRVNVIGVDKVTTPTKLYMYKMEVHRANVAVSTTIYRSFNEFKEFYLKLRRRMPVVNFPNLLINGGLRSNTLGIAQRRLVDVVNFVSFIFKCGEEIKGCDLVYTFFHSLLRDNGGDMLSPEQADEAENFQMRQRCQVQVKMSYSQAKGALSIFVGHAKNLSEISPGNAPDSYIKTYLRPDMTKQTKQKTHIVKSSCNPTFNSELIYHIESAAELGKRALEVSVWYSGGLRENTRQYSLFYALKKLADQKIDRRGNRIIEEWIEMCRAGPSDFTHG